MSVVPAIHTADVAAAFGYKQTAIEIKRQADALVVDSAPAKVTAVDLVARIRRTLREAEAKRTSIVKPHNDHVKVVNDAFKRALTPFVEADGALSRRVIEYDRKQKRLADEAAARAERERLESAARLREAEQAEAAQRPVLAEQLLTDAVEHEERASAAQAQAVLPARTVHTEAGTTSTTKRWTYDVVNLAEVPAEYLEIKAGAVREAINAGARAIPGLRIYQAENLAVRT